MTFQISCNQLCADSIGLYFLWAPSLATQTLTTPPPPPQGSQARSQFPCEKRLKNTLVGTHMLRGLPAWGKLGTIFKLLGLPEKYVGSQSASVTQRTGDDRL